MVVADIQSLLEHINRMIEVSCVLIGKSFAVVELGIRRHELDCSIEVLMSVLDSFQCEEGIATIEESSSVRGVEVEGFVVLSQTLVIELVVIES